MIQLVYENFSSKYQLFLDVHVLADINSTLVVVLTSYEGLTRVKLGSNLSQLNLAKA